MRSMTLALLGLSWGCGVCADALQNDLNRSAIERYLPTSNLPIDAYRPVAADVFVAPAKPPLLRLPTGTRVWFRKVHFEGGTVYPLSDLKDNYQDLIERAVTLDEVLEATARLTERYHRDGYFLSYAVVPDQDFSEGSLRVVLVEGYVRDVELRGDVGPVSAYVTRLAERIRAEKPLTQQTFERYTRLMNHIPGVTLKGLLSPASPSDGAARLIVRASRQPLAAAVVLNDGSRADPQALLSLDSQSQTALGEQLSVRGLFAPGDDHQRYYRLDYAQYLDSEGSQLNLAASTFRTESDTPLHLRNGQELLRDWRSDTVSAGLSQPLIAAPDEWLNVAARLYAVRDRIDYRADGTPLNTSTDTDTRVLSFEGDWRKADERQLRMISGGVYQGLDYLGAKTNSDYDLDFLRLRVSGVQRDRFFDNWQGVASGALYWSDDSLPDSERAVFGGRYFGRGYPVDQASGDKGWGLAYEVNYSVMGEGGLLNVVQPYAVLDTAQAWFNKLDVRSAHLASLALGVRMGDLRDYNLSLEIAKPLADAAFDSVDRQPRFTVSVSLKL